jgi:hypothetical protein
MRKNAAAQADLAISWEKERPAARFFCDAMPAGRIPIIFFGLS